ncbi:MAG: ComF family protein [Candidatus Bipolaricaulota bacterium]|nr:ComF family protein [Candidatus Bipolaricaulota bacterium]
MTTSGATRTSFSGWHWFSRPVRWVRDGGAGVAALLYPAECARCGAPTRWGVVVCGTCVDRLPRVEDPVCRQCGEGLANPSLDLCPRCGTRVRGFDRAISLGPYDDGWRELLHAFKFAREKAVGRCFARELGVRLAAEGERVDVVTHVPMTRSEERARGFNPSRFLARATARRLGLPERRLLAKVRVTVPQRALSARERETNLRDAFRAVRSGRGAVLLVDDLLTTGATADECARTLKESGFDRVIILTVAHA